MGNWNLDHYILIPTCALTNVYHYKYTFRMMSALKYSICTVSSTSILLHKTISQQNVEKSVHVQLSNKINYNIIV